MYGKAWSVFGKPVEIAIHLYDNQVVYEAATLFNTLDRQCYIMLQTSAAGHALRPTVIGNEEAECVVKLLRSPHPSYAHVSDSATFTSGSL